MLKFKTKTITTFRPITQSFLKTPAAPSNSSVTKQKGFKGKNKKTSVLVNTKRPKNLL
jgi:hypothetical protein